MTEQYGRYQSTYPKEAEEYNKRMLQFLQFQLMQGGVMIRKHGPDIEMLTIPARNVAPDTENRLHILESQNSAMRKEISSLKREIDESIEGIRLLNENLDSVVEGRIERALEEIGFRPITFEVLSQFREDDIEKTKSIIIEEIRKSSGDTDPGVIAQKFNLSFKLVAGCFDLLLSEGKIGEISE